MSSKPQNKSQNPTGKFLQQNKLASSGSDRVQVKSGYPNSARLWKEMKGKYIHCQLKTFKNFLRSVDLAHQQRKVFS